MDFSLCEPSKRFSNKTSNLQSVFQSYCSSLQLSSVWPPLPVCLLRGLQGGISPNYLYWSGETGEYQTGRSSLSCSCFFPSVASILPSLLPRGEKTHRSIYVSGIALTATTRYCSSRCSDLLFTFRLLWLNLPSCCSSFNGYQNVNGCFSASNLPLSFRPSIQITVAVGKILH